MNTFYKQHSLSSQTHLFTALPFPTSSTCFYVLNCTFTLSTMHTYNLQCYCSSNPLNHLLHKLSTSHHQTFLTTINKQPTAAHPLQPLTALLSNLSYTTTNHFNKPQKTSLPHQQTSLFNLQLHISSLSRSQPSLTYSLHTNPPSHTNKLPAKYPPVYWHINKHLQFQNSCIFFVHFIYFLFFLVTTAILHCCLHIIVHTLSQFCQQNHLLTANFYITANIPKFVHPIISPPSNKYSLLHIKSISTTAQILQPLHV